ncbi:hypothetical protein JOM56_004807 [Amanita muscaria]
MNLPVSVEYELDLKFFEYANLGLPMSAILVAAIFGPLIAREAKGLSIYPQSMFPKYDEM